MIERVRVATDAFVRPTKSIAAQLGATIDSFACAPASADYMCKAVERR